MNKLVIPVALIGVGLGTLMTVAIIQGGVPELQVSGVAGGNWKNRELKVHGLLASVERDQRPLRFTLKDKDDPSKLLPVFAELNKPDTFQLEYDVAVQGRYDAAEGVFRAEKIFTKCPSKYEADEKKGIGSRKAYEQQKAAQPKEQGSAPAGTQPETAGAPPAVEETSVGKVIAGDRGEAGKAR